MITLREFVKDLANTLEIPQLLSEYIQYHDIKLTNKELINYLSHGLYNNTNDILQKYNIFDNMNHSLYSLLCIHFQYVDYDYEDFFRNKDEVIFTLEYLILKRKIVCKKISENDYLFSVKYRNDISEIISNFGLDYSNYRVGDIYQKDTIILDFEKLAKDIIITKNINLL